jgi:hypothetical protein
MKVTGNPSFGRLVMKVLELPYSPFDLVPMGRVPRKTLRIYSTLLTIGILVKENPIPHETKTPMTICVRNLGNMGKGISLET